MHHIAIMRKEWGLTTKILTGKKTIESRWYKNKSKPWDAIVPGDTIFFKDSGCPIALKAQVVKVLQFANLTPQLTKTILMKYGKRDGIEEKDFKKFYRRFKDKRYCLLIFLENPRHVKPFNIDKSGFGVMAAWITINNIKKIQSSISS